MTETRSQNFTAIHRSSLKFRGGICRFKTFCMRIFARKFFLQFRCSSIYVKMRVLSINGTIHLLQKGVI